MPRITVDDGVQINYHVDDFTDPWTEERETILIHHGSAENSKFYIPMVPALARRYQVLRVDARGRGESSAPPEGSALLGAPEDASPTALGDRCAKDALSLIDQLGIRRVHWFGVVSGGDIGISFAVSHPDRVKSLILCTVPYKYPADRLAARSLGEKDTSTAIEKLGSGEWWKQMWGTKGGWLDLSKADTKMAEWNLAQRQKIPTHVLASLWKWVHAFDYSPYLPKIHAPTLLLAPEKSYLLEQMRYMQQQIPNARLIVFNDVSGGIHLIMPDRVTDAVLDFLQNIGSD